MQFRLIIIAVFFLGIGTAAKASFEYTADCRKAYEYYMSLHLAEGHAVIVQEIRRNPENLMAVYLSDYEDCLQLVLNCDKTDYDQRKDHMDERLAILTSKADDNSPWYRLCKAGIYMHWTLIEFRFDNNFKAAALFRKSYLLLKENNEKFPDFEYNDVFAGLEQTIIGTIPDSYKWLVLLLGMKGSVKKGTAMLEKFISTHSNNDPLREEALIYNVYLKFYLQHKQPEVWKFLNSNQFPTHNNLLNTFVKANIAVNYRQAESTIHILQEEENNPIYAQYPIFNYEMGCALFFGLSPQSIYYFQQYLDKTHSNIYVKDSWQKMALIYYLQHDTKQAAYCRQQAERNGNTQMDADKQAERFSEKNTWPNYTLLQSRLLIDGGYYQSALAKLTSIDEKDFATRTDKLEYYFRLGRVYDELGNEKKAIYYYEMTINTGRDQPEQYAARAALQMGFFYEKAGNTKKAIDEYKECLRIRNHDFQASIDQQAKAGINRLTKLN